MNINEKEGDGYTPLHIALQRGNLEIAKLLLSKDINVPPHPQPKVDNRHLYPNQYQTACTSALMHV